MNMKKALLLSLFYLLILNVKAQDTVKLYYNDDPESKLLAKGLVDKESYKDGEWLFYFYV